MERLLGDVGDELVRPPRVVLVVIVAQGEVAEVHNTPPFDLLRPFRSLGRSPDLVTAL